MPMWLRSGLPLLVHVTTSNTNYRVVTENPNAYEHTEYGGLRVRTRQWL